MRAEPSTSISENAPSRPGRRALPALLGALLPIVLLLACDGLLDQTPTRSVVGVILPFSAESPAGALQVEQALRRVLSRAPESIELVFTDDGGEPARTAEKVLELVMERNVVAIVGALSSPCALAAAERAETLKVPFITPMATNAQVTAEREWAFRLCFTDTQQGAHMARFAWGSLGQRRVVIIRDVTNDYSVGLADAFADTFLELGGNIASEISYRRGVDDPDELLARLRRSQCDTIYLPLYRAEATDILGHSRELWQDGDVVVLGGDALHSSDMRDDLRLADRVPPRFFISSHFAPDQDSEAARRFAELVGGDPNDPPTAATALGYDTAHLLRQVLKNPTRSRAKTRESVYRTLSDFQGVTGSCSLDKATGQLRKDVQILTWSKDRWVTWQRDASR